MNNPSEKEMLAFSEKLNLLWREQKMNDAKKLLKDFDAQTDDSSHADFWHHGRLDK